MESLKIEVDFTTASAVGATQAIISELGKMAEAVEHADTSVSQAEKSVQTLGEQLGTAAGKAAEASEAIGETAEASQNAAKASTAQGESAEAAAGSVANLGEASTQTAQSSGQAANGLAAMNVQLNQTNNVAPSVTVNVNNVAGASRSVGAATSGLAGQVKAWLEMYVGIYAVMDLFQKFIDKLHEVRDAQNELTTGRLSFDDRLNQTVANLGLGKSPTAQAAVINLLKDLSKVSPVNEDQGLIALNVAQSFGHDPRTAEGMKYAAEVGYAQSRLGMDKETVGNFAKVTASSGNDSAQGFADIIAKAEASFRLSGSTDFAKYASGFVTAMLPEVGKGVDMNRAAGVYSAFLQARAGEEAASQATQQIYRFAQAAEPKTRDYFAHIAAQTGVTKVTDATDDEARAALAGDAAIDLRGLSPTARSAAEASVKAGRSFRSDQEKLDEITAREKEDYVRGMPHGRKPLTEAQVTRRVAELKDFDPQQAARELAPRNADAARTINEKEEERKRLQETLDAAIADRKARIQSEREATEYNKVNVDQRVSAVVLPTMLSRKTTEQMNEFNQAVGGRPQILDNLESLLKSNPIEKINEVAAAMKTADAAETDASNRAFEQFDSTKQHRAEAGAELDKRTGTDSGDMYGQRLLTRAKAQYLLNAKNENYVPMTGSAMNDLALLGQNSDKHLADAAYDALDYDFKQFFARTDLSQGDRAEGEKLYSDFKSKVGEKDDLIHTVQTQPYSANVASFARSFGLIQSNADARSFDAPQRGNTPRGDPGRIVGEINKSADAAVAADPVGKFNRKGLKAEYTMRDIHARYLQLWGSLSDEQKKTLRPAFDAFWENELGVAETRVQGDAHSLLGTDKANERAQDAARRFADFSNDVARDAAKVASPTSGPPSMPSPQPSAPPSGPHADASAVHHHYEHTEYHTHYGNAFFSNGEDEFPDLRGPAET